MASTSLHGQKHMQVPVVAMLAMSASDQDSADFSSRLESARVCIGDQVVKKIEPKAPTVAGVQPGFKRRSGVDNGEAIGTVVVISAAF